MIRWLIKRDEEVSLAWFAIVLPITCLSFWIPGVIVLAPLQLFLSERVCGLILLIFLAAWLVFVITIWLRAIKVVRQAKVRNVAPGVFHLLQGLGLVLVGANILMRCVDWNFFLQWLVCMDIAL